MGSSQSIASNTFLLAIVAMLFMINKDGFGECDFILSFNNKITEEIQRFPIHKRIYLCMENPSVWHPSSEFLNQFGLYLLHFSIYKQLVLSSKVITSFPCVPWFYDISFSTRSGLEHVPLSVIQNSLA